jgi:predicted Fe-Mo cluster-binding NifX family protein
VIEYQPGGKQSRTEALLPEEDEYQRVQQIEALGLDLLICGAVSRSLRESLEARGIKLVSFISGDIEEVLNAWEKGVLPRPELMMPGCGRNQGCKRRNRLCPLGRGNRRRYRNSK